MGVPDMAAFIDEITAKAQAGTLDRDEKALGHLMANPQHPGIRTNETEPMNVQFGQEGLESCPTADSFTNSSS